MKKFAIIAAGGAGTRMGSDKPKQFLLLKGKPVICHTVKVFLEAYEDMQVVVVFPEEHIESGTEMIGKCFNGERIKIVPGGGTRFQSVKNGLAHAEEESIIFVHDGVRCLVSKELIHRCYECAIKNGSAIPVVSSKDSVRLLTDDGSRVTDRNKVMLVQTPQTFQSKILLPAFNTDYREEFTDEATVVEAAGFKVSLVEGEENNIKITRPVDLVVAEKLAT